MGREYVHWIEVNCAGTVFRFRIGILWKIITIRLRQDARGRWEAQCSHVIQTPLQQAAYYSFRMPDRDKDYTLLQAVTAISMFYAQAIEAGCTPSEDWLRPFFNVVGEEMGRAYR